MREGTAKNDCGTKKDDVPGYQEDDVVLDDTFRKNLTFMQPDGADAWRILETSLALSVALQLLGFLSGGFRFAPPSACPRATDDASPHPTAGGVSVRPRHASTPTPRPRWTTSR